MIPVHDGMNATNEMAEYRHNVLKRLQAFGEANTVSTTTATSRTTQVIWNGKTTGQNMDWN